MTLNFEAVCRKRIPLPTHHRNRQTMAKPLPSFLTQRKGAHLLIARLQHLMIRYQGWKDARAAQKARKRRR